MALAADREHHFSKPSRDQIVLVEGHGVEGDAHAGPFVRTDTSPVASPASQSAAGPSDPSELFATLVKADFEVGSGDLGESITLLAWTLSACRKVA